MLYQDDQWCYPIWFEQRSSEQGLRKKDDNLNSDNSFAKKLHIFLMTLLF